MKSISVSVIIPLWNKESHIRDALLSVLHQTCKALEIIVVDDGSTDQSVDVVKTFHDACIDLIMQENKGASAARNRGLSKARGNLIAFLDADDEWMPTFLETTMRLYSRFPNAGAFASAYQVKHPDGHFERAKYSNLPASPWEGILRNYFRAALGNRPVLLPSSTAVKRTVLEKLGGFTESEKTCEDLELWARIAFKYPIAWSSREETIYRRDIKNPKRKTAKLTKDIKAIDTLKEGFRLCSPDKKKDILQLIGKYYKLCALNYMRYHDKTNALRCIKKSVRYSRDIYRLKHLILLALFSMPRQVWETAHNLKLFLDRTRYRYK